MNVFQFLTAPSLVTLYKHRFISKITPKLSVIFNEKSTYNQYLTIAGYTIAYCKSRMFPNAFEIIFKLYYQILS